MERVIDVDEECAEWDFDNAAFFLCSSFTWNKDKTKLRISIPTKEDLKVLGVGPEIVEMAPEKMILLEFKGEYLERLMSFMKG